MGSILPPYHAAVMSGMRQTKQTKTTLPKICRPAALGSDRSCAKAVRALRRMGSINPPPQPPTASVSHQQHPHTHQPEVMRPVARAPHSWEVMWNRNAFNSRSGIHRWGCVWRRWRISSVRVYRIEEFGVFTADGPARL